MSIDVNILKQVTAQVVQEMTAEDSVVTLPIAEPVATALASGGTTTMITTTAGKLALVETRSAERSSDPEEVVVVVPPVLSTPIHETIIGLPHVVVFKEVAAGIEEKGLKHRFVKVYKTADIGFIAHQVAKLSDSGIGIGIQSRGITVIHQKDLPPLSNVELFGQSPLIDLETFRAIGKNAAKYAKGESPQSMPIRNDQMVRPKYQAITVLLHDKGTAQCDLAKKSQALWAGTA